MYMQSISIKIIMTILSFSLLTQCVTVPRKVETHDDKCKLETKLYRLAIYGNNKPYLEAVAEENNKLPHCPVTGGSDKDPIAIICGLIGFGIVTVSTSTFLVSGSIVVVNNTIRWIERQGKCDDSDVDNLKKEFSISMHLIRGTFISTKQDIQNWISEQTQ